MSDEFVDIEHLGWLPLQDAILQAATAWEWERARAWDYLRRWMSSGTIRSKTRIEDIPADSWSEPLNHADREGWCVPWPVLINKDDFEWLLRQLGSGSHREIEAADQAILLHLYDQVDGPPAKVPVAPLTNALREPDRSAFKEAFVRAVQAGLFDDKGLEFLCQGQWSPLDSTKARTAVEVAGDMATFERRYVLMAALTLSSLMAWATKFDVPLPDRIRRDWSVDHIAAEPLEEAVPQPPASTPLVADAPQNNDQPEASDPRNSETAGDTTLAPEKESQLWRRKPGAQTKYDWPGMYRHLLACNEEKILDLKAAHTAAAEFFDAQDKYPSRLSGKVIELFREASGVKSLRDVLVAHLKEADT